MPVNRSVYSLIRNSGHSCRLNTRLYTYVCGSLTAHLLV